MKKHVYVSALALASGLAAQDASATVAMASVTQGTIVSIGCTAPSSTGATVYSIDASAQNSSSAADSIALPSGVTAGGSCSQALNQMYSLRTLTPTGSGYWSSASTTSTTNAGVSPVNITIPGSGYSLQQFTFVAQ